MKHDAFSFSNINSSEIQIESIEDIYNQLVNAAIIVSAFVAIIVTTAALFREMAIGHQNAMILPVSSVLVTLAFLFFLRRLSYNIKAFIIPGALFIWGSIGLFRFGLIGMGIPTLITSCILLSIFLGSRFGLAALAISLFVIASIGVGIQQGQVDFKFDMNSYAVTPHPWLLAAGCVIYYTGLIVATLGRLHVSLGDAVSFLNKRTSDLRTTNEQLKAEISDRKQAEEEVRRLRNLLRNVVDSMPSVLVGVDTEGKVTEWNREAENETGLTADHAKGRMLMDVFPQIASEMEKVQKAITARNPQKDSRVSKVVDGMTRYSDITVYPLVSNGIEGAVIRLDDVTERVRIEEMMIQSEKMLSVGGLAAGMAHEINNPLAGIIQNVQVMKNRMSGPMSKNITVAEECNTTLDAIEAYMNKRGVFMMLDSVMESGKTAAKIVDNMLSFSRKDEGRFTKRDLAELLDKTVEIAEKDYDLKKKYDFRQIEIVREYDTSMPKVMCEGSKIQQVFLNILKNGAYAMSENKENIDSPRFILRVLQESNMASVEIEDNGPGMDEMIRKRIFEPFFTTKRAGVGTGLGLSVSYFIITENHGGTIEVAAEPGRGTTFIVRLPIERDIH